MVVPAWCIHLSTFPALSIITGSKYQDLPYLAYLTPTSTYTGLTGSRLISTRPTSYINNQQISQLNIHLTLLVKKILNFLSLSWLIFSRITTLWWLAASALAYSKYCNLLIKPRALPAPLLWSIPQVNSSRIINI